MYRCCLLQCLFLAHKFYYRGREDPVINLTHNKHSRYIRKIKAYIKTGRICKALFTSYSSSRDFVKFMMKLFLLVITIFVVLFGAINAGPVEELDQAKGPWRVGRDTCDLKECNDSCKKIFLPGGVCVRNKCKCDII